MPVSLRDELSFLNDSNTNNTDLIIKNGVDFYFGLNYFLKSFSFITPKNETIKINLPFRNFICAIVARVSNNENELIDNSISNDLDCSRETVCRLRKRLKELQFSCSQSLIQITEGEKHQDSKGKWKYKPTKYQVTFLDLLSQAIENAQNSLDYEYNRIKAIEREIDKIIRDTPAETGWKNRKEPRKRTLDAERQTARLQFKNWGYRCLVLAVQDNDDSFLETERTIDLQKHNFETLIVQSNSDYYLKTFGEVERMKKAETVSFGW